MEERRLSQILEKEEASRRQEFCALCERPLMLQASEKDLPSTLRKLLREELVCSQCCQQLHRQMKSRETLHFIDTVEDIRTNEEFSKYLRWVAKVPPETLYT